MFLLDTDILTLFYQGHAKIDGRFRSVSSSDVVATSVISPIQILRGRHDFLLKAANAEELLRARDWPAQSESDLARMIVVPLDESAATEFERLLEIKSLRKIGRADILIASIALAQKATLVTRNLKHFKLVPGLKCENWAD